MIALLPLLVALAGPARANPAADLDRARLRTHRAGMATLGGWAVANLAVGGVGMATATDPRWCAFHQGNAAWNVVNLGIAGASLWGLSEEVPGEGGAAGALARARKSEVVLAVNAGLDVAYLTAGAWLWERGAAGAGPQQVGLGQALVIQGAFLLAFDATLLAVHRRSPAVDVSPLLAVRADGASMGLAARF